MIPLLLFEKEFPEIKELVANLSKNPIVQSFKTIETKQQKKIIADKGTSEFKENKQLYTEALLKQVKNSFYINKELSKYLTFSTSDRITYFNSTVRVGLDGKLLVQEKITVFNGDERSHPVYGYDSLLLDAGGRNNEIKRGLVRAFPLYYINKYRLFQNTTFKLKEVWRNGVKENYHTKKQENGILVYTGSSDVLLPQGSHTYTIIYETDRQLKRLKNFDELYWNVTGSGWSFRIDSAQCTIILPKGALPLSNKCHTGPQGAANEDCSITSSVVGDSATIVFKTTRPLPPRQGITIATSWPKGIITGGPSSWQQLKYYVWNNRAVFLLPLSALFSAIFCFIFWLRYGRDPKKGPVYPQFEPPAGYGPAALGYIYLQKFDRQLTAATIVDAAVRNRIKIDVEREGTLFKHNKYNFSKSKLQAKPPVSAYEDFQSDINDLVGTTIKKGKYNSDLGSLNTAVQKYCESNFKNKDGRVRNKNKGFFASNISYTAIPALVCTLTTIWCIVEVMRAAILENYWQIAYFVGGVILCVIVLKIFSKLLAAYNPEGRKLADKIEGFRMFLSTADEKRFDTMNPPKRSLELYEKYLPFAIALDCEIAWGQKFEEIINTAFVGGTVASSFSHRFSRDNENFSSSFASTFSGAISSASSPPSSSSGGGFSFGGGSSGGGGGGGGGGGW